MDIINNREIDYYIKGLPFDIRQSIFKGLDNIGLMTVKSLLEKEEGFPKFKRMGLSQEQILRQIESAQHKFEAVNQIMEENERYPLFYNSLDTLQSSREYVNLLTKREREELIEKFGCTWEEYIPAVYKKKVPEGRGEID